jgi:hypothetical protein
MFEPCAKEVRAPRASSGIGRQGVFAEGAMGTLQRRGIARKHQHRAPSLALPEAHIRAAAPKLYFATLDDAR